MVEALVAELSDITQLLDSQVKAGLSRDDVLESMYRSWIARLGLVACKYSAKQKAQLTEAINAGPWLEVQVKELARVVLQHGQQLGL